MGSGQSEGCHTCSQGWSFFVVSEQLVDTFIECQKGTYLQQDGEFLKL